jgi:hypothetical protein
VAFLGMGFFRYHSLLILDFILEHVLTKKPISIGAAMKFSHYKISSTSPVLTCHGRP